jgi:hypothetical protein
MEGGHARERKPQKHMDRFKDLYDTTSADINSSARE